MGIRCKLTAHIAMAVAVSVFSAFQTSDARATTFNWDFVGTFTYIAPGNTFIFPGETISGSGSLTATYVSGSEYLVTSITGAASGSGGVYNSVSYPSVSDDLIGPLATGTFYNNDNKLFFPMAPQFVDSNGLGIYGNTDGTNFNLFYGSCGDNIVSYCLVTGGNHPGSLASLSLEVTEVTPTPLPAALPLFASGLGALGLLGWRRKRKAAALAA
jgi:hypothetical protein